MNPSKKTFFVCVWLLGFVSMLLSSGCGAPGPNYTLVTVNSEPQGAKLYEEGRYIGTTPMTLTYTIQPHHYNSGVLNTKELVCVQVGYTPVKESMKLQIKSQWQPDPENYWSGGNRYNYNHLFLLQPDPRAASFRNTQMPDKIHIKTEGSDIEETLKWMQFINIVGGAMTDN